MASLLDNEGWKTVSGKSSKPKPSHKQSPSSVANMEYVLNEEGIKKNNQINTLPNNIKTSPYFNNFINYTKIRFLDKVKDNPEQTFAQLIKTMSEINGLLEWENDKRIMTIKWDGPTIEEFDNQNEKELSKLTTIQNHNPSSRGKGAAEERASSSRWDNLYEEPASNPRGKGKGKSAAEKRASSSRWDNLYEQPASNPRGKGKGKGAAEGKGVFNSRAYGLRSESASRGGGGGKDATEVPKTYSCVAKLTDILIPENEVEENSKCENINSDEEPTLKSEKEIDLEREKYEDLWKQLSDFTKNDYIVKVFECYAFMIRGEIIDLHSNINIYEAGFTSLIIQTYIKHNMESLISTGMNVLEIGLARGTSSIVILNEMMKLPQLENKSKYIVIDPYQSVHWKSIGYCHFSKFVRNYDKNNNIKCRLIEGPSEFVGACLEPKSGFDIVFIDGSHKEDIVIQDLENAHRLLKIGGIIIFDDALHPEPKDALIKFTEKHDYDRITINDKDIDFKHEDGKMEPEHLPKNKYSFINPSTMYAFIKKA